MSTESLLIELRTEELPPKALNNLGESFTASIIEQLQKDHFIAENTEYKVFASPRRLGVLVKNVASMQADQQVVKKGPSVANGMKDGEPTKAVTSSRKASSAATVALSLPAAWAKCSSIKARRAAKLAMTLPFSAILLSYSLASVNTTGSVAMKR